MRKISDCNERIVENRVLQMIDDPMCRSTEATAFDIDKRFPERVSMHTIKQQGIPPIQLRYCD